MTRISCAAALAATLLVIAAPSAGAAPTTFDDATAFRDALSDEYAINWDELPPGAVARTHYQASTGALLDSSGPFNAFTVRTGEYPAFSAPNVVTSDGTVTDVTFTVPSTSRPAAVNAFGVVFSDVDIAGSYLALYDQFGARIAAATAAAAPGATSFVGIKLDPGVHAVRARIVHGTSAADGGAETGDEVALDDFIFARPVQPRLTIGDVTITEGDDGTSNAVFTVTRDVDTSTVLVVPYATLSDGAGEGDDYTGKTGTIAFNAGVTTRTIEVAVRGDRADELDEAFRVLLLDDGQAALADGDGRAMIIDNDPAVVTVTPTPTPTPTPAPPAPTGYDPAKDKTLPRIRVGGIPRKKCTRKDFVARINVAEDGLATLRIRLDKKYISDRAVTAAVVERLRLRVPARALKRGKHALRIVARDRAGNRTTRTFRFRRC